MDKTSTPTPRQIRTLLRLAMRDLREQTPRAAVLAAVRAAAK